MHREDCCHGQDLLLCMMQLHPGRGGNLHLASKFLTSASNCHFQGASLHISQCIVVCMCPQQGCVSDLGEHTFCTLLRTFGYSLLCKHLIVCLNGTFSIQVWIGMSLRLQSRCSGGACCRALCFKVLAKQLESLALYFFIYNLMHF